MFKKRTTALGLCLCMCLILGAVFMLYARTDFIVQMANQLWSCF